MCDGCRARCRAGPCSIFWGASCTSERDWPGQRCNIWAHMPERQFSIRAGHLQVQWQCSRRSPLNADRFKPECQHPATMLLPRGLLLLLLLPALACWAADPKPGLLELDASFDTTLKQLPPDQMVLLECYAHWQVPAAAIRRRQSLPAAHHRHPCRHPPHSPAPLPPVVATGAPHASTSSPSTKSWRPSWRSAAALSSSPPSPWHALTAPTT